MSYDKRVDRKPRRLWDGRFVETIGQVRLNPTENSTRRCADTRPRQPAVFRQEVFMQVGDLLLGGQRDPHRLARYASTSDR